MCSNVKAINSMLWPLIQYQFSFHIALAKYSTVQIESEWPRKGILKWKVFMIVNVNVNYCDEMNPVSSQSDGHHDQCLYIFVSANVH